MKKEETATFIKVTQNPSFSEKNPSFSEKNPSFSEKNPTKEKKEKEIKINKKESGAKAPVSENVSDSLFDNCKVDQAFKEYMDHRKKMKSPMTDRAIVLTVKKLKELSFDGVGIFDPDIAVQIIENSIQNGWKGLFPLKKTAPIEARRGVSGNKFDNFTPRDGGNINDQMLKKTMKKLEGGT